MPHLLRLGLLLTGVIGILGNLQATPTTPLVLTGFAILNETESFACLLDPSTGERFSVSSTPDAFGNQILSLQHQKGQGLHGSSGTALIHNQIRTFGNSPTQAESGSFHVPPAFAITRLIRLSPKDSFKSQGYELGHRAALNTIPLVKDWTTSHARTRTFLLENPLPPNPTQGDLLLAWQGLLSQVDSNSWWGKAPKLHLVIEYPNTNGQRKLPYSSPPNPLLPTNPLQEEEFYKGYVYGWNDAMTHFLSQKRR